MTKSPDESRQHTAELVEKLYPLAREIAARQMVKERATFTLQATEVVNEAFIRLFKQRNKDWQDPAEFRFVVASVIRRVLVDHYRSRGRQRRGGALVRVTLDPSQADPVDSDMSSVDWLALDQALTELKDQDRGCAKLVELRYFGGFSVAEAAESLGISVSSAVRDWRFARGWLQARLSA